MRTEGFRSALRAVRGDDRWCTPSLIAYDPPDLRLDDLSVSYSRFGSVYEHSSCFGALERLVAQTRKADRAWLFVDGSTGANRVAMRVLAARRPDAAVLLAPNAHHSAVHAAIVCGVRVRYFPAAVMQGFDAILPPSPDQVDASLTVNPQMSAVIVTSPSYEGIVADVPGIADVAHRHGALLVVDAAWGAHFGHHPCLPGATAETGADLVVESLHKCGGAPQGAGTLLLASDRIDAADIDAAYRELMTTSPSIPMLAGIEGAAEAMTAYGSSYLDRALASADELRQGLLSLGLPVLTHPCLMDGTKVTLGGVPGFELAASMEKQNVIAEKATARTVLMLATMQLRPGAPARALDVIGPLAKDYSGAIGTQETPVDWLAATPQLEAHVIRRGVPIERVGVEQAAGHIAAEIIELYPPGIPVIAPGWVIQAASLDALEQARAAGGRVVASDPSLATVAVVASTGSARSLPM